MKTKKDLEERVKELEKLVEQKDNIIWLLEQQLDFEKNKNHPTYITPKENLCIDGKPHEYPTPWLSITPPSCKKCGKIAEMTEITFGNTTGNVPWDFNEHGGNVMNTPDWQYNNGFTTTTPKNNF